MCFFPTANTASFGTELGESKQSLLSGQPRLTLLKMKQLLRKERYNWRLSIGWSHERKHMAFSLQRRHCRLIKRTATHLWL